MKGKNLQKRKPCMFFIILAASLSQSEHKFQGILRSMSTNTGEISGSVLCIPCGMCCDGTLFEFARLGNDEKNFATSLGMTLLNHKENYGFQLPCHLFKNGFCSIYEQPRPKACGGFECKLLRSYKNNKITLEDSLEIVNRTRAMHADILRLLPRAVQGVPSLPEIKRQMQMLAKASAKERLTHLDFLILAAKYEMFLRTHFLVSYKKKKQNKEIHEIMEDKQGNE